MFSKRFGRCLLCIASARKLSLLRAITACASRGGLVGEPGVAGNRLHAHADFAGNGTSSVPADSPRQIDLPPGAVFRPDVVGDLNAPDMDSWLCNRFEEERPAS